jgi:hypothetical protein
LAVWPFDGPPDGRALVAEIYPRLFLRRAGAGNEKVRAWDTLAVRLAALGSDPCGARPDAPSDHETDALVSAAGLRAIAADPAVWSPPALDARARAEARVLLLVLGGEARTKPVPHWPSEFVVDATDPDAKPIE